MNWSNQLQYAAEDVYDELGPWHSESVYEAAMAIELHLRHISGRHQVPVTIKYRDFAVGTGFIDILVDEKIVVEVKAVAKLSGKDEQQVKKYLAATGLAHGLLINFGNELEIVEIQLTRMANGTIEYVSTEKGNHDQTSSEES